MVTQTAGSKAEPRLFSHDNLISVMGYSVDKLSDKGDARNTEHKDSCDMGITFKKICKIK